MNPIDLANQFNVYQEEKKLQNSKTKIPKTKKNFWNKSLQQKQFTMMIKFACALYIFFIFEKS